MFSKFLLEFCLLFACSVIVSPLIADEALEDPIDVNSTQCNFDHGGDFDPAITNLPNDRKRRECMERRVRLTLKIDKEDFAAFVNQRSLSVYERDPMEEEAYAIQYPDANESNPRLFGRYRPGYNPVFDEGWGWHDRLELEVLEDRSSVSAKEITQEGDPIIIMWMSGRSDERNLIAFS